MHYGAEEMFFVVSGMPTLRNGKTEEQLSSGDVVYCP
jgi:mannose-6-phosphate isomerase-like protein (cupin superfamily)